MNCRQDLGVEDLGTASNVFLKGSCLDPSTKDACATLVDEAKDRASVIVVSVTKSPRSQIATLDRRLAASPARIAVLSVTPDEEGTESIEIGSGESVDVVKTGSTPSDLTKLGILVTDRLNAWSASDGPVVVCFDSLTPLLQYNPLDGVYHFLRIISQRIEDVGATAHYHYDPIAHDEETTNRLQSLFDHAVEIPDDTTRPPSVDDS